MLEVLGIIEWPMPGNAMFFVVLFTKGRGYFPLAGPFRGSTRLQGAQDAYDWAMLAL